MHSVGFMAARWFPDSVLAFSLVLGLAACGPTPTPPLPPVEPQPLDLTQVPWSAADVGDDPDCKAADARLRGGVTIEEDYWSCVICVMATKQPAEVELFLPKADEFREKSGRFYTIELAKLETIAVLSTDASEKALQLGLFNDASDGDRVAIYLAPEKQASKPPDVRFSMGTKWRGIPIPWSKPGHYDITLNLAKGAKIPGTSNPAFSKEAIAILTDASQDADLFSWTDMAAHAQTETNKEGKPIPTAQAEAKWIAFVQTHLASAREPCGKCDSFSTASSLYHLGYLLHAVEDLASHRGRTNPEHAYNSYGKPKNEPDTQAAAYALAADMMPRFLDQALRGPLAACVTAYSSYHGPGVSYTQKIGKLGFRLDLTPKTYRDYRVSKNVFVKTKDEPGSVVRWIPEDVTTCETGECAALLARLVP